MLVIGNDDVAKLLTMREAIAALEESYRKVATREVVCRPRIDIRIPTSDPAKTYVWGSMEGGSTAGYFAIRMKSDVSYETRVGNVVTREKYSSRPGLFCGLILLTSVETGEPLALLNDGVLQHMRVGADGAIGVKFMAKKNARVVGMLGSGGMSRSHMEAFRCVRDIAKVQVFSPTRANREAFGREMAERYGIEVEACERPEDVYRGADIVAALTDSTVPVLEGRHVGKGAHLVNIGGGGLPDAEALRRVDVYLRFGNAPAPVGRDEPIVDEFLAWAAGPVDTKRAKGRAHGVAVPDKVVSLADVAAGRHPGRSSDDQITFSERGNLQGAQFYALAAVVYEKAKAAGMGKTIPTEWLLQDIRD